MTKTIDLNLRIQTRDHNGRWKDLRFAGPSHSFMETAISSACHLDQDGLFSSDVRIVDATGKVVMRGDNKPH